MHAICPTTKSSLISSLYNYKRIASNGNKIKHYISEIKADIKLWVSSFRCKREALRLFLPVAGTDTRSTQVQSGVPETKFSVLSFSNEPTVTGDTFLPMTEKIALRHVLYEQFSSRTSIQWSLQQLLYI
jgi:hypothetical protein